MLHVDGPVFSVPWPSVEDPRKGDRHVRRGGESGITGAMRNRPRLADLKSPRQERQNLVVVMSRQVQSKIKV